MPVRFKIMPEGQREWSVLNELQIIMTEAGALFGSANETIHMTARLGADWSTGAIRVEIERDRFRELAQEMMDADPKAAMAAFGAALILGPRRPVYDDDGRELG